MKGSISNTGRTTPLKSNKIK